MFKQVTHWIASRTVRLTLAGAALSVLPAVSMAADAHRNDRGNDYRGRVEARNDRHDARDARPDFRRDGDHDRDDDRRAPAPPTRIWVEPVYRTVTEQQWVPPIYRTVTDQVWHEPVVQRVTERVWVPDKYESRPVDPLGHVWGMKKVLVTPGHYEDQCHDVVIKPGYYEDVTRQELVCDGHYETVTHQEVVAAGHWEDRGPLADNHRGGGVNIGVHLPF